MTTEFSWDELVSEAETASEPLPNGTYNAVVEEATYQLSKKFDPQIVLRFSVQGGPHNGKAVWNYLTATAGSDFGRQMFVSGVHTLLGKGAKLDFNQDPETIAAPFVGKRAVIETELDDFNGRVTPKVKRMKPVEGSEAPTAAQPPQDPSDDIPPPQPLS